MMWETWIENGNVKEYTSYKFVTKGTIPKLEDGGMEEIYWKWANVSQICKTHVWYSCIWSYEGIEQ